jgi:hypothetical protein
MTLLKKRTCILGVAKCLVQIPVCLNIFSLHLSSFYVQEQEAPVSITFGRHVSIPLKIIYSES